MSSATQLGTDFDIVFNGVAREGRGARVPTNASEFVNRREGMAGRPIATQAGKW